MSQFHEGRVAATFSLGKRIETSKEAYESEISEFVHMKNAFTMAGTRMDEYKARIKEDIRIGKIALKEGDCALTYISACIELIKQLFTDAEAKRLAAVGAAQALQKVVDDVKVLWDAEKDKLTQVVEYKSHDPVNLMDRPLGYLPNEIPTNVVPKVVEDQHADIAEQKPVKKRSKRGKEIIPATNS